MSEEAAVGTPVGTIMAAAVNQTIIYSIIEGNEGGEYTQSFLYESALGFQLRSWLTADKVATWLLPLNNVWGYYLMEDLCIKATELCSDRATEQETTEISSLNLLTDSHFT